MRKSILKTCRAPSVGGTVPTHRPGGHTSADGGRHVHCSRSRAPTLGWSPMTRRGTHHPQDDPSHETEVEAAAMSTAIAGLRRRLKRHGIEHPSVRRELGKLEELLTTLFEQAGRPGRHRRQASKPVGRQAGHEVDLKPDPAEANTAAEY